MRYGFLFSANGVCAGLVSYVPALNIFSALPIAFLLISKAPSQIGMDGIWFQEQR